MDGTIGVPQNEGSYNMTTQLKYGDYEVIAPESAMVILATRTLAHILGNEVAAKVKAWKDNQTEETGKTPNDAEVASYTHDCRQAQIARIEKGELGLRQGGPRGTALETVMRAIAVERLTAALKAQKVKMPVGKEIVTVQGATYTRAELIAAHVKKNETTIRKMAEERMASTIELADMMEELV